MNTELLTEENIFEQIDNDWKWITEVITHKGQVYSHSSKIKAVALSHYLGENQECFKILVEYAKRRKELIDEINNFQLNLFA